jgi:phospholipase/lecithinase/hemolysin
MMERVEAITRPIVVGLALTVSMPLSAAVGPYSGIYVFGDSLSDSGNVFAATTLAPINPVFPDKATPLTPPYFDGRFSNGPIYADVLAGQLGFGSFGPSLFPGGTNYAWGGASTGPAVLPVPGLAVPSIYRSTPPGPGELPSQLQLYGSFLQGAGMSADPDALYVLWGGGNDLRDAVNWAKDHPATAFADGEAVVSAAIANLQGALQTLDALGAQRVLVPNAPDVGVTPETIAWDTDPQFSLTSYATALTGNFNVRLADMLDTFQGLSIIELDTYGLFNDVLANPLAYGITDAQNPCLTTGELSIFIGGTVCSSPDEHLFWDNHHPTSTIHALLGEKMYLAAIPEPQTYLLMLAGIVLVFALRRRAA